MISASMSERRTAAAPAAGSGLQVREMLLSEVDLRISYFHDACDEHRRMLGVDRALLPSRRAWREFYEADAARPLPERENYTLVWELDDRIVGFSSTDAITFGEQAFMHLHILDSGDRSAGMGAEFVRLSAATYFRALELQRLYCQPNAFNVAPNRTLQRAGFRYEFTRQMQPSAINFPQPITRWVLDRHHARSGW
jgi:RimJ/RimL family protein N-acetyltransferase